MFKKIMMLMLIIVIISSIILGCSKESGLESAGKSAKENTQKKDTIFLSMDKAVVTLDPHIGATAVDVNLFTQVYEPIYRIDQVNGGFIPTLATDYSISDDKLTWTFTMRDGVKFHNGDILTAEDFVFNYMRAKEDAPVYKSFLAFIDYVETNGNDKINIKLKAPNSTVLQSLSQIPIISKSEFEEQGEKFGTILNHAGTGPYKVIDFDFNSEWKLEAFPDYWGGEASIKHINWKVVTDIEAGQVAFESGELDFYTPSASSLSLLDNNSKFVVEKIPANHITYAFINWKANEYLKNDNVRKAINYAINKEDMNSVSYDGFAVLTDFMSNSKYVSNAPTECKIKYEYNPEKAKQLLSEAGFTKGIDVGSILVPSGSVFEKIATVMQAQLAEVGIISTVEAVEANTASTRFKTQEYCIGVHGSNGLADFARERLKFHSTSKGSAYVLLNGDKFDYKYLDKLLDDAEYEIDEAKRKAIYTEANDVIMDTGCWIPILHKTAIFAWNTDLNAIASYPSFRVYDWSWK